MFYKIAMLMALFMTFSVQGLADRVPPKTSYTFKSKDHKFVFVMLGDKDVIPFLNEKAKENESSIRKKYKSSGLYLSRDYNSPPVFTVDWYSYRIYLSSDNNHLIKMGDWAEKKNDEAFSFYRRDRLLKRYKVEELVDFDWLLPHSISHIWWAKEVAVNSENNTFKVETLLYDEFVFNIKTGQMISSVRYSRILFIALLLVPCLVLLLIIRSVRKRRSIV